MASLIPGYEYDIFISYRQKDNKGDRWVSEFVETLKTELESTFKEEISVYFDINPHDGLLETHDVNASLKEKLKCLVFIPIISRTYCDPKSFAWEHEFKAFVEQASHDQFGLKVKLPGGNVASRVLPVRIHDLDTEDIKLCESVLDGFLRGVEFNYKEPGVNRSLSPKDHEEKNLNNTNYRNQMNKVALAIKEIILGLKTEPAAYGKEPTQRRESIEEVGRKEGQTEQVKPAKLKNIRLLSGAAIIAVLLITALIAYPKLFKPHILEKLRLSGESISVAVMPFLNMTNDTIWNVWQGGIQNELINMLTNSEELKVRQTETINSILQSKSLTNYSSITPSVASSISLKVAANVFIYGTIKKAGPTIRLNTQLIASKTGDALKSFQIEGSFREEMIFTIIDSLSTMVKNFLIISKIQKQARPEFQSFLSTASPEAYRLYMYGNEAFSKLDFHSAVELFSQAIAYDSNYVSAINQLAFAYGNQHLYDQARQWSLKSYRKRDQMSMREKIGTNWTYSRFFETPNEGVKYLRQLLKIDDQSVQTYVNLGDCYNELYQYNKAIPEFEKSLEIYKKWNSKPWWVINYTLLGEAYHKTGQYKKEKKLYKQAEKDFPNDLSLISRHCILALSEGDTKESNKYIEKYKSICKDQSWTDVELAIDLAYLYDQAGMFDKAEEIFRKVLLLEPDNPNLINYFAFFLIDKDRNIIEGLELADKALNISPDNSSIIDTKGWGLFKQGKNKEALELLEKSWALKPIYNHEIYLHLEEVKKAVAGMK